MNFEKNLEKYAKLAIRVGVNIQKDQVLVLRTPIECADFARKIVKEAYLAGAKKVHIEWSDEECSLIEYMNAPDENFLEYPKWTAEKYTDIAKEGGAFLTIYAQNPDLLKDVNPERIANFQKASATALKKWRSYTSSDKCKWSIISIPTVSWATKVFPDVTESEAMEKLWDAIFKCTRVDTKDPIFAWKNHNESLKSKTDFLNKSNFKSLHFKSNKTDLIMHLPENHIWQSGSSKDPNGDDFNANIPTEEIFSMPHKFKVDGVVYSTKPLVYGGNTIDEFWLKFENGKILEFDAKQGFETLKKLIETDEGSHYLGEVALVPFNSPISNTDIIFYNTLFDENASCHFAIGSAYKNCIKDGTTYKDEELDKYGINDSLTHVDFMIGNSDMNIVGTTYDEKEIKIFENGNWAF